MRDAATDPRPGDFCAPVDVGGTQVSAEVDSTAYVKAADMVDDGAVPITASDEAVLEGLPWRSPASSRKVT
jgi:hypothetical protein